MNSKLIIALVLVTAVAGNPFVKDFKNLIHRRATVSPNLKVASYEKIAKSAVAKPAQKTIPGPKVKVDGCGVATPTGTDSKVVGGEEAVPHSYPWQVKLNIDDTYFCGGSLISDSWVVTAAHCMDGARTVDVLAGAHDQSATEDSQQTLTSTSITVHEDWAPVRLLNDISLIQLPESFTFNEYVNAICLPSGDDIGAGIDVTITGWGLTSDSATAGVSDVLMEVTVPTAEQSECLSYYSAATFGDDQICIDTTGGHGACNGDSGGPLNYTPADSDLVQLRGIVSYGSSLGCESGGPDVFTRVNHYVDWIETQTGITV